MRCGGRERRAKRSVWMIVPVSRQPQEVRRVALKAARPLRHFQPYGASLTAARSPVLRVPMVLLQDGSGQIWDTHVSRHLSLDEGVAVVVGANSDPMFADSVYVVVEQGERATRFKVIVGWRPRDTDREAPSLPSINPVR